MKTKEIEQYLWEESMKPQTFKLACHLLILYIYRPKDNYILKGQKIKKETSTSPYGCKYILMPLNC